MKFFNDLVWSIDGTVIVIFQAGKLGTHVKIWSWGLDTAQPTVGNNANQVRLKVTLFWGHLLCWLFVLKTIDSDSWNHLLAVVCSVYWYIKSFICTKLTCQKKKSFILYFSCASGWGGYLANNLEIVKN